MTNGPAEQLAHRNTRSSFVFVFKNSLEDLQLCRTKLNCYGLLFVFHNISNTTSNIFCQPLFVADASDVQIYVIRGVNCKFTSILVSGLADQQTTKHNPGYKKRSFPAGSAEPFI